MFLNSSIGISEGVRATLFLRDCRKRNIIHRGGVDIKWNGPRIAITQNTTKPVQVQLRQLPDNLSTTNKLYLSLRIAKLLDPCRTDPRRLEFDPAACHQCCKRELISWPTDKCRLLEYL